MLIIWGRDLDQLNKHSHLSESKNTSLCNLSQKMFTFAWCELALNLNVWIHTIRSYVNGRSSSNTGQIQTYPLTQLMFHVPEDRVLTWISQKPLDSILAVRRVLS